MTDCIFCSIVAGTSPAHVVWEDEAHVAFLSIFPNTDGLTVVIPKKHHPSYVFEVPDKVVAGVMSAAKQVAQKITTGFPEVGRVATVFEGYGVNHLHMKLYPLHGTAAHEWKPINSTDNKYFHNYEGYISTHEGMRADDEVLAKIAQKIRDN